MAVYSEFGSFGALVEEVVAAGFASLAETLRTVERTDDPIADLLVLGGAYRAHAYAHPHLYSVMVGTATLGGHQHSRPEPAHYLAAVDQAVELVERAMAQGLLDTGEPLVVGTQLITALHGGVTLEMSGLLDVVGDPFGRVLLPLVHSLFAGLGADPGALEASLHAAMTRLAASGALAPAQ